jgi:hypothetical protein
MTDFYIPISSHSLPHYFGRAVILPAKFYNNKPEDIQNRIDDSILLCESKWVNNCDCSIKVVLTDDEVKQIKKISNDYFECELPIPISRVKKVYFLKREQLDTTLWNINAGAAFFPRDLAELDSDPQLILEAKWGTTPKSSHEKLEISRRAKYFDHILGAFAFMRVAGGFSNEYSASYFRTLSFYNKLVEKDYQAAVTKYGLKSNDIYGSILARTNPTWQKWEKYVYQPFLIDDLKQVASKEGVQLDLKIGLVDLDRLKSNPVLYDFAVLALYGNRNPKSTENLISDMYSGKIPQDKVEEICFLFGLHNGYTNLRSSYKVKGVLKTVKFKLDSLLDYYTIESIYQSVFKSVKENTAFPYLDSWVPKGETPQQTDGIFKVLNSVIEVPKAASTTQSHAQEVFEFDQIYKLLARDSSRFVPPFGRFDEEQAIKYYESLLKRPLEQLVFKHKSITLPSPQIKEKETNTSISNPQTEGSDVTSTESIDFDQLSMPALRDIAKEKGVKRYSKMTKPQLLVALKTNQPSLL